MQIKYQEDKQMGKVLGIVISSIAAATAILGIIFFSVKRGRNYRTNN
jgi:hypothetical protein